MELKEILKFQREFDKKHGWDWSNSSDEEKLKHLQYGTIAITGEIGEFANNLKKIIRESESTKKLPDKEEYEKLKEELTDIFIYFIKLSDQALGMDIEKEYMEKMKMNQDKFKKFEK